MCGSIRLGVCALDDRLVDEALKAIAIKAG